MADKPMDRRQFFRKGLSELFKPLANALEPVERTIKEFEKLSGPKSSDTKPASQPSTESKTVSLDLWLRPPGALPESKYLSECSRCGKCVEVCPAECIKLDPTANRGKGAPYIDANVMACVVCDDLSCMKNCPTGALVFTDVPQIKMGTAVWRDDLCVRTTRQEDCRKCVDICPIGSTAIELAGDEVRVHPLGCIGCGLCQQHCPTEPKSVMVIPVAARGG